MAATTRAAKHSLNEPRELAMTRHGIARHSSESARSSAKHPHVLSTIITGDIAVFTCHYVGTPHTGTLQRRTSASMETPPGRGRDINDISQKEKSP